jgi:hypothetical protein
VRHAGGHYDHVALCHASALASDDGGAAELVRLGGLRIGHGAAGPEHRRPFEHVDQVGIERVDLGPSVHIPVAGVNHVVAHAGQDRAALESRRDHLTVDERHLARGLAAGHPELERLRRRGARERELLVLLRARRSAHPDAADDVVADHDRDPALERREVGQRDHCRPAGLDDVLERAGRALEQGRGPRLADGDVGAGGERAVEPLESHQVPAVVHDGDDPAGRLDPSRLADRGRDDLPRPLEGERLLLHDLSLSGRRPARHQRSGRQDARERFHDRFLLQ